MDEEIKRQQEEKIRAAYGDSEHLIKFLTDTMDNFAYRYISTTKTANPRVAINDSKTLVVMSYEDSMVNALKIENATAKEGIKDLARRVPKAQAPTVQYVISCHPQTLESDAGKLVLTARVNWNYPSHEVNKEAQVEKSQTLTWNDLQDFRKGFPLAMQDVCDLFL